MEQPSLTSYLDLGWRVFPCHTIVEGFCSCDKRELCQNPGKHPRTRNGVKDATDNRDLVKNWYDMWSGQVNWALACGIESNVFVVDVDLRQEGRESFQRFITDKLHQKMPKTLTAVTGGGGQHLFFTYPKGTDLRNRVNWLPGVDIRSNGGYVILPPGRHISGSSYRWAQWPSAVVPAPVELIVAVSGAGQPNGGNPLPDTSELTGGIPEGQRDDYLFRLACRLRRDYKDDRVTITALILDIAAKSGFEEKDALAKIEQAFKQDHSGPPDIFSDSTADIGDDPIYRPTDMGNRDRLVRAHGDDIRWVPGLGWRVWTDTGWMPGQEEKVKWIAQTVPDIIRDDAARADLANPQQSTTLRRWADMSESNARIDAMITLTKSHPIIQKETSEFDSNPEEIACRNGMLDLRNGTIRPFTRDDLFTRNTNVIYDPTFHLDEWDAFLLSATDGDTDLMRYLQLAAGYTLTGSVAEECFFIISGPTASGKSTYLDGLIAATGGYHDTTAAETFMRKVGGRETPREEILKLVGSRIITTSELPEGERFDDSLLKRITGGDRISARALYKEAFTFMPQFKLWMATNHDPVTSDSAMFRRIKRVPFTHTIPEEKRNRDLKRIIRDPDLGGRAVLAWAAEGARMYLENGGLSTPTVVSMSTDTYQGEQDMFQHYLQETTVRQQGSKMKFSEAYGHYSLWCKDANERPLRRPQYVQKLRDHHVTMTGLSNDERMLLDIRPKVDTSMIPFMP